MSQVTHHVDCPKCLSEKTIEVIVKRIGDETSVDIKKCSFCKKQSYFKELFGDFKQGSVTTG